MTKKEALDWLISRKEHYEMDDNCQELAEAIGIGIDAIKQELCEDAISRAELLKAIDTWDKFGYTETGCFVREPKNDCVKYIHYDDAIECIKGMPPVNPQNPKTGHWIVDGSVDCYLDKVRCHCSECGKRKEFPADYDHIKQELSISYKYSEVIDNFCPNCGAKMLEVKE